jgi:hypothetical protein
MCLAAGMHAAHARIRSHAHTRTAAPTHMHTHMDLVVRVYARARTPRRVRTRRGRGSAAVGGNHSIFSLGQSTAAGSAASSELDATLRADRAAAAGRLRPHPVPRAGRAARASHACAGLGRRRTTGNTAAAASNAARRRPSARRGSARGSSAVAAAARARRWRRRRDAQVLQELALAERLGERLHLRPGDGPAAHSAFACGRARRATMGGRGDERAEAMEGDRACTHAHPHARDRHTDACGTGGCTLKADAAHTGAPARAHPATARPHARLDAARKYMCLNKGRRPYTYPYLD